MKVCMIFMWFFVVDIISHYDKDHFTEIFNIPDTYKAENTQ